MVHRHVDVRVGIRGYVVLALVVAGVRRDAIAIALAVRDGGCCCRGLLGLARVGVGVCSVAGPVVAAVTVSVALDGGVAVVGGEGDGEVFVVERGCHG